MKPQIILSTLNLWNRKIKIPLSHWGWLEMYYEQQPMHEKRCCLHVLTAFAAQISKPSRRRKFVVNMKSSQMFCPLFHGFWQILDFYSLDSTDPDLQCITLGLEETRIVQHIFLHLFMSPNLNPTWSTSSLGISTHNSH